MLDISHQFQMEILVAGRPVTEYHHQGNLFIEGRKGSEFVIRLTNNSYDEAMAIVAVDGLNVIDGSRADHKGAGYLINPQSHIDVKGWVKDMNSFNAFYFAGKGDSYSERVGKGNSNNGVIGAMFFRPKLNLDWQTFHEAHPFTTSDIKSWSGGHVFGASAEISASRGIAVAAASASTGYPTNSLGAGHGSQGSQKLSEGQFTKRDPEHPDALLAIYYDDRQGLERRGIIVDQTKVYKSAFPAYNVSNTVGVPQPPKR